MTPTVPIPAALRVGSPVVPRAAISDEHRGVVLSVDIASPCRTVVAAWSWSREDVPNDIKFWHPSEVELDLRSETGRAHLAWWAHTVDAAADSGDDTAAHRWGAAMEVVGADYDLRAVLANAAVCPDPEWWTPTRIDTLRRVACALAGLEAA